MRIDVRTTQNNYAVTLTMKHENIGLKFQPTDCISAANASPWTTNAVHCRTSPSFWVPFNSSLVAQIVSAFSRTVLQEETRDEDADSFF
jgi:hypothetical protein